MTAAVPTPGGLRDGLTSGGGLGDLLPITPDSTASTATSLLSLTPTQLLDQVIALLSLPGLTTLTSSTGGGVAGACASTLSDVLPLLAHGMTLQQAATTVRTASATPATHR
jgi:hypothetical protein